ncbi:MAG: MerR family transcriptional regulator [Desulfobacter sp.]|nr:MAG: MerR family transcriptional regulator [Desulfobacter sp.]
MKYSISKLAKEFGLSRSTLLYYDSIGLLSPDKRTTSDYRIYTDKHYEKLKQICLLRSTGLSLKKITEILKQGKSHRGELLRQRLNSINDEINQLRTQQKIIVGLLANTKLLKDTKVVTKDMWVNFLRAAGLDDKGMWKWHMQFEATAPQAHQDFLEALGLCKNEIKKIRAMSSMEGEDLF